MPRTEIILRVFIASPGDVKEERDIIDEVIQELNNTWSKELGIRLESLKWETHTYPSIGIDAQDVVNSQIDNEYDIFIGIMWTRFGTNTMRAGSGTSEEFFNAYSKFKEDPNNLRIMFYFKDEPILPSQIIPEQILSIQQFKAQLAQLGSFHWSFNNRDEFQQLIRIHLSRQVQAYNKTWGINSAHSENLVSMNHEVVDLNLNLHEINTTTENEEEGYFDLLDIGLDSLNLATEAIVRIGSAIEELGNKINVGTDELNKEKLSLGGLEIKRIKKISNRVADSINTFAVLMEADVPNFANSNKKAFESFIKAYMLYKEFKPQDNFEIVTSIENIKSFIVTMAGSKIQIKEFMTTLENTPRATTLYNKAKKRAVNILNILDTEFSSMLNLASELERSLSNLIAD